MHTDVFNTITAKIIESYKAKDFFALRKLASVICSEQELNALSDHKLFNFLLIRFHPDRVHQYSHNGRNSIDEVFSHSQLEQAENWATNTVPQKPEVFDFEDYLEEISFDEQADGYYINYETSIETDDYYNDSYENEDLSNITFDTGFITALKRKIYGRVDLDFPMYLLEDLEEIEVAGYDIDNLEGIEFCTQSKTIDLSLNQIFDLYPLSSLSVIEELYLSNNNISMLDALTHLPKLRVLDLSHNHLTNIEALLQIPSLEYVNLTGNNIAPIQKKQLQRKGIIVVG